MEYAIEQLSIASPPGDGRMDSAMVGQSASRAYLVLLLLTVPLSFTQALSRHVAPFAQSCLFCLE